MLWAWESPQDLRQLPPRQVGAAFLAATFLLQGDQVKFRPRMQPLRISPGTFEMAVVRISADSIERASYSPMQRRRLLEAIGDIAASTRVKALQIDFDAKQSERSFYRALVPEVRARLGAGIFLSITALASWCEEDDWLARLGVDEVVPMVFHMGPAGPALWTRLSSGGHFASPACRKSIGVSIDEPWLPLGGYRRVYLFPGPGSWTTEKVRRVLREMTRP